MLSNFMKLILASNSLLDGHYVEVYAGGAAIAWSLLFEEYVRRVHVNDIDTALYAFWASVVNSTEDLCRMVRDTAVTIRTWHRQRAVLGRPTDHSPLEIGFAAFFLNRTNRSGIIRGGVIGGKTQSGPWKLDARFNKHDLISRIHRIARYADRISLYNLDAAEFLEVLPRILPEQSLLYLDPPYYIKGKELYEHHYTHTDHAAIARMVTAMPDRAWIVTYDALPQVLQLYRGFRRLRYDLSYSAQARYVGSEVMFLSNAIIAPRVSHPARVGASELRQAYRFAGPTGLPRH